MRRLRSISRARSRARGGPTRRSPGSAADSLAGDEGAIRRAARWEAGREAEDAGRFALAAERFSAACEVAGFDTDEARFRAGLLRFAAGGDRARALRVRGSEGARFWSGVLARAAGDTASGNAALRAVASLPGYGFYRTAARDTLGLRAWDGALVTPGAVTGADALELTRARDLAAVGAVDDALRLLAALPRADSSGAGAALDAALEAARVGFAAGRVRAGVGAIERALRAFGAADSAGVRFQGAQPWVYPPAFEPPVLAAADSLALEPALLWGVMRQESRYDEKARSSSGALGLMQLLPRPRPTCCRAAGRAVRGSAAARSGDEREARCALPRAARAPLRRTHRGGAVGLQRGSVHRAPVLARADRARGRSAVRGDRLNADAQDYARKILANRAAYRELRPARSR